MLLAEYVCKVMTYRPIFNDVLYLKKKYFSERLSYRREVATRQGGPSWW